MIAALAEYIPVCRYRVCKGQCRQARHIAPQFGKRGKSRTSMTRHNEDWDKHFKRLGEWIAEWERIPIKGKRNPIGGWIRKSLVASMHRQRKWPKVAAWRCTPGNRHLITESANQLFFHSSLTEEEKTWILEVPLESVRDRLLTKWKYSHQMPGTVLDSNPRQWCVGPYFTGEKTEAHRHSVTYSNYWMWMSGCKLGSNSFQKAHSFHHRTHRLFYWKGKKPSELSLGSEHPEEEPLMQHFSWTKGKAVFSIWRRQYLVPHRSLTGINQEPLGSVSSWKAAEYSMDVR